MPRGECGDVDAAIGERLIDVLAELIAFAGLVTGIVMLTINGVQVEYDPLHCCEDLSIGGGAESPQYALERAQGFVGRVQ
ncbi:hypothetical protein ABZV61_12905 [Streptomyces sp900116325]|uniref:Uncharacterized protein n=1 Tax=Streptomyces sp. 900116325 TaxID=3154295 RepID=A0ABV2U757_9ACTN